MSYGDRDNEYGSQRGDFGSDNQSYKNDAGYKGDDKASGYGGSHDHPSTYGSSSNTYGSDNKQSSSSNNNNNNNSGNSGLFGGLTDKFNNMAGGGAKGEANEDMLDKGKLPSSILFIFSLPPYPPIDILTLF